MFYKEMDAQYPGSKFVLTTRALHSWIQSMYSYDRTYTKQRAQVMLEWIFGIGSPTRNGDHYKAVHQQHVEEVKAYFRYRPGDLLVLDTADRNKMKRLCNFLGIRRPRTSIGLPRPYPHRNIGKHNRLINARNAIQAKLNIG